MINVRNESISESDLDELTIEIRKLEPKDLDNLLKSIGFIVSTGPEANRTGEGEFKAITFQFLKNIKSSFESARIIINSIAFEIDIKRLKQELAKISK